MNADDKDTEEQEAQNKRLKILKPDQIKLMYDKPSFSNEERGYYFNLSSKEKKIIDNFRSINTKINFILQLGYFKYKFRFFSIDIIDVKEDIDYIIENIFKSKNINFRKIKNIEKIINLKNRKYILNLFNYKYFKEDFKQNMHEKSMASVKLSAKPIYIFNELCQFFENEKVIVPKYTTMQEFIGKILTIEKQRLTSIVTLNVKKEICDYLDNLVAVKIDNNYEINFIKKSPKDFSFKEIKQEIKRGNKIREIYPLIKNIASLFLISNECLKYYASLVDFYSTYRLSELNKEFVRVYLICYFHNRYEKFNDNIINAFISHVNNYKKEAEAFANNKILTLKLDGNKNVKKAAKILRIFIDKSIPENEAFSTTKGRALKHLDEDKISIVADLIENKSLFDDVEYKWKYIESISMRFKKNLRPIILNLDLNSSFKKSLLLEALNKLKENIQNGNAIKANIIAFKENLIYKKNRKYFYSDRKIIPDRYEFLIYKLLLDVLDSGDIFCEESTRFKSFENELISEDEFKEKDKMIEDLGISTLKSPIKEHLIELENILESKIVSTNKLIKSNENIYFSITKTNKERWHLDTPTVISEKNKSVFEPMKQIDLIDILYFCESKIKFTSSFDHILGRYIKSEADIKSIFACLIAWATNMGFTRMGDISDISYNELITTSDDFFRLETLQGASDKVLDALYKLSIFCQYHINEVVHSSSDGQKFETKISTINSRYSPKYFGLKKGVVSYTLVANHLPINSKIIGANEHESHYVFDILFNNSNEIRPKIHSTDTHGSNDVNFAILKVFGYQFAPRYKDFYGEFTGSLSGFKNLNEYSDLSLKPKKKINTQLIIDEWDTIQRIMISLGKKTTTQSNIVRKLNSYSRKNKTRKALWEYNRIIQSIYLLDYVDSPELRQNVQLSLCRGESYHQLKRAVAYANFGKLKFKTEDEQQIWNECARLITNLIIYYNEEIFINLIENGILTEDSLKHISPVAWQHINFFGRYEFNKKPIPLDLNLITKILKK